MELLPGFELGPTYELHIIFTLTGITFNLCKGNLGYRGPSCKEMLIAG